MADDQRPARPLALRFDVVPPEHAQLLGQRHQLSDGVVAIGRVASNDIALPDPRALLTRRHCAIVPADGGWCVSDFSTNGTFVNGMRVGQGAAVPIKPGDRIALGDYELTVLGS
jgi:predicted component of type VI protein secretion system